MSQADLFPNGRCDLCGNGFAPSGECVNTDCTACVEFTLTLDNGHTIRTDTYRNNPGGASYVRVCDPQGDEVAYWVADEWEESPEEVMGAILGAAGARPRDPVSGAFPRG